jgi:hypothetical protein
MKQEFDSRTQQHDANPSKEAIMTQIKNEINSIDEEICDLRESLQNQLTTGQSPIINITAS